MIEELKIFEKHPLKECIKECLDAGYFPATQKEFLEHKKNKTIKRLNDSFDTSTLVNFETQKFKDATLKELQNIEKTYNQGWRLVWVSSVDDLNGIAYCSSDLYDNSGRLLGIKKGKK